MSDEKRFGHMVYFTLKDASPEACDRLVAACEKYLSGHPGTELFAAGTRADSERDVVDKEFHVALQLVFKDKASQDAYQVAERHDQFIAEQKDNWANVRVFDSLLS